MDLFSTFLFKQRESRSKFKSGWAGVFLAGLFAIVAPEVHAAGPTNARDLAPERRAEIEKLITTELQDQLNRMQRTAGQSRFLTVKVKFDPTGEFLIIDPGKGFLNLTSETITSDTEQQMQQLYVTQRDLLDGIVSVRTQFRFDGKDLYHYYPSEWRPNPPSRKQRTSPSEADAPKLPAKVVISPSHGLAYYFSHHGNS